MLDPLVSPELAFDAHTVVEEHVLVPKPGSRRGLIAPCARLVLAAVLIGATAQHIPAQKRSMTAGMINAGGSLGQFLVVPAAQGLLSALDWKGDLGLSAAEVAQMKRLSAVRGIAAALQAARAGARTLLLTPGSWLGGMVSAAGVCAPDCAVAG